MVVDIERAAHRIPVFDDVEMTQYKEGLFIVLPEGFLVGAQLLEISYVLTGSPEKFDILVGTGRDLVVVIVVDNLLPEFILKKF